MRFLADENIPKGLVEALRSRGHDVEWVRESKPGVSDAEVVARAHAARRVIITCDLDFGTLIVAGHRAEAAGVILIRFRASSPSGLAEYVVDAIDARVDWEGHFSVVESDRIRMRRLKP